MTELLLPGLNIDNTSRHWLIRIAILRGLITTAQCPVRPELQNISTLQAWQLLESFGVSQQKTLETILNQYALEPADFSKTSPSVTTLVNEKTCRKYHIVPLYADNHFLTVATFDPFDSETELFLRFTSGRFIKFLLATPEKIASYSNVEMEDTISHLVSQLSETLPESNGKNAFQPYDLDDTDENLPFVTRLVNTVIIRAIASRASDIHILHNSVKCQIRFRIDGVLHKMTDIPEQIAENVMSRLKIMAGIDSSSNQKPTDGRAKLYAGGRLIDLRFNFVPTVDGKKTTIRIQDSRQRKDLSNIGYSETELSQFKELICAKVGLILVTGPTGSGKTNTLYAALDHIRDSSKNIVSIEDPVEFMDEELTQIQVNNRTGFTFAVGLRAAMRQDPDIILVGEIRDRETAETALQASETGHLVLSTLHSRSAAGTLLRLLELGINKGLLASSIAGVVAQRLLRKICERCARPVQIDTANIPAKFKKLIPENPRIREVTGCPHCHQSGYFGRIAIAEIMIFTPEIQQAINEAKPIVEIEELARSQGMLLLQESAFQRYFSGETTLEEINRVLEIKNFSSPQQKNIFAAKTEPHRNIKYILLIYSDTKVAEQVKQNLLAYDFVVFIINDVNQVKYFIENEQLFDLVICEMKAPNISALRLTTILRNNIKYVAIPILVIGEPHQDNEIHQVLELGANDYLIKPIGYVMLLNRILALLNRTSLS